MKNAVEAVKPPRFKPPVCIRPLSENHQLGKTAWYIMRPYGGYEKRFLRRQNFIRVQFMVFN